MKLSKIKDNYFPELTAFIAGRSKPLMVSVNLTEICNQSCIYCEIGQYHDSPSEQKLSKDDLFWIVDEMAKNKIRRLSMCGGEPFLFNPIIDVVAYADRNNIRCNITSNGMTIHSLNARDLKILKSCKATINISIDSFKENIQVYTRGSGQALSNAIKSIQQLQHYGIPVTILSAISKFNYYDLFDSLKHAYALGIRQVLYQPIIYYSNYPEKQVLDNKAQLNVEIDHLDELKSQLIRICNFEKKHRINTNVYRIIPWIEHYIRGLSNKNGDWFFHDVLNKFFCREIYAIIDIDYNGGIQACGLAPALVSIKENKHIGLLEKWSKGNAKLKADLANGNYIEACNGCCHKFSRNMYASAIKYPLKNRRVLVELVSHLYARILSKTYKNIFIR